MSSNAVLATLVSTCSAARRLSILASLACLLAPSASAQWQVVSLHPSTAVASKALGTRGGQQVGTADSNAALWYGTSESFVNLGPGVAVATDGQYQVGNTPTAARWSGTAASRVILPPPAPYASYATGIDHGEICGYWPHIYSVYPAGWSNTFSSLPYLGLPAVMQLRIDGIAGGRAVGVAGSDGSQRAVLWPGTGVTPIFLHPTGSSGSAARGIHGTVQVGWVNNSAALWTGSAASWVNLAPPGSSGSEARAVFDSRQVGFGWYASQKRAGIWSGTAASWIDLHAVLPPGYFMSEATGVWIDGYGTTFVCGWGTLSNGPTRALLWYEPGQPISFCAGDGSSAACPCSNSGALGHGCENSVDPAGGLLSSSGSASVANDQLTLIASGIPNSPGLYYQGTTSPNGGTGAVFGDGLRCASGTIVRLGIVSATNNASQYPRPGIDLSVSVRGGVTPYATRVYQLYYRDTGTFCTPSGYNTTNALRLTWYP